MPLELKTSPSLGYLAGNRCVAQLIIVGLAPFVDPNFDSVAGMTEEIRGEWILPLTSMDDFDQIKEMLNVDPDNSFSDERISGIQAMGIFRFHS